MTACFSPSIKLVAMLMDLSSNGFLVYSNNHEKASVRIQQVNLQRTNKRVSALPRQHPSPGMFRKCSRSRERVVTRTLSCCVSSSVNSKLKENADAQISGVKTAEVKDYFFITSTRTVTGNNCNLKLNCFPRAVIS